MRREIKTKVINEIRKNTNNIFFDDVVKEGILKIEVIFDYDIFQEKNLSVYIEDEVITLNRMVGRGSFVERNEMKFKKEGVKNLVEINTKHYY